MKHLRLIVLRELDHFRGWFFLLLGLVGLALLIHVLVLTILPGRNWAEFLIVLKSYIVPGFFGTLCGLMGYADSPGHGSHEFRTRPVRLKTLYLGKLILIAATAACLVLVQSLVNFFAGSPLGFWLLWIPLFMGGLSFFFLAALFRPTVISALQLMVIVALPWIFGDWVHVGLRSQIAVEIYALGLMAVTFVAALYALVVFCGKCVLRAKIFWVLFLPYVALAAGAGVWLLPFSQRSVSPGIVEEVFSERLNPELRLTEYRDERVRLVVSEPKTNESVLQRLRFMNRVVKLESADGIVRRIPLNQWGDGSYNSNEENDILRALGLIPPLSKEQLKVQLRYDPESRFSTSGRTSLQIPPEMRGKEIEVTTEGAAHYWEVESLGALPIRKGATLASGDLKIEIVALADGGSEVRLRVHSRSRYHRRLGVYQKNVKEPYRYYGRTCWLTSHDAIRGMTSVDIFDVRIHFDQIEESEEAGFLYLHATTYRGSTPFQSKPFVLDLSEEKEPSRLLRAKYPILPSVIPIEQK